MLTVRQSFVGIEFNILMKQELPVKNKSKIFVMGHFGH